MKTLELKCNCGAKDSLPIPESGFIPEDFTCTNCGRVANRAIVIDEKPEKPVEKVVAEMMRGALKRTKFKSPAGRRSVMGRAALKAKFEDGDLLDFSEALIALKEGKKVRQKSWSNEDYCFAYLDGKFFDEKGAQLSHDIFTTYDLLAEDWQVV